MNFFVYIVECADGTFYTGYTHDIDKRLKLHNNGSGSKYVRSKRPATLVFQKKYRLRKTAMKAERKIKNLSRPQKEKLVNEFSQKTPTHLIRKPSLTLKRKT